MMERKALYFDAPGKVVIRSEELERTGPDQVCVRALYSAISPGTEMMIYRGRFPAGMALDESIDALEGGFDFPFKYGYSAVGRVIGCGQQVAPEWEGRLVFAFQPHQSHFMARPEQLLPLPAGIDPLDAVFLPNMETAVNFLMDGAPLIGERVAVFGQGVVGLLTTALLGRYPLESLISLDRYALRRKFSLQLGADRSLDPDQAGLRDFDLVYELSGAPSALDAAISAAGFEGRVVVGSWYGARQAQLDLGGHFHRSRIRLISSQVSTIAAHLSGRWSKQRRFDLAWRMLARVQPQKMITGRVPFEAAERAYRLFDRSPQDHIQIILEYE